MFQGMPQIPPPWLAASMVEGKNAARSSAGNHGPRSSSQPARANSGTQMTSIMRTSKPARPPSRLMT